MLTRVSEKHTSTLHFEYNMERIYNQKLKAIDLKIKKMANRPKI